MKTSEFPQVERAYPNAEILCITQYWIAGKGWIQNSCTHLPVIQQVMGGRNMGATKCQLKIQDANGQERLPDYGLNELTFSADVEPVAGMQITVSETGKTFDVVRVTWPMVYWKGEGPNGLRYDTIKEVQMAVANGAYLIVRTEA